MRALGLSLAICSTFALGGCLPMVAANVGGRVIGAAAGQPQSNQGMEQIARDACTDRAEPYGTVHLIYTDRRSPSTLIIWGTTQNGATRQSFKCVFGTNIRSFTLRKLPPQPGYTAATK